NPRACDQRARRERREPGEGDRRGTPAKLPLWRWRGVRLAGFGGGSGGRGLPPGITDLDAPLDRCARPAGARRHRGASSTAGAHLLLPLRRTGLKDLRQLLIQVCRVERPWGEGADGPVAGDEDADRQADGLQADAIRRGDSALRIEVWRRLEVETVPELADGLRGLLEVDRQYNQPLRTVGLIRGADHRQLVPARRAPGGPEVDQHRTAA